MAPRYRANSWIEQAHRTAAGDRDARRRGGELGALHGVPGDSRRLEECSDLPAHLVGKHEADPLGHDHPLGESPVTVHRDEFHLEAVVGVAGAAEVAPAARDVRFTGDAVAHLHAGHRRTDRADSPRELVTEHDREAQPECLCRRRPLEHLAVGAADRHGGELEQHLVGSRDGLRMVGDECGTAVGARLDDGTHGFSSREMRGWRERPASPATPRGWDYPRSAAIFATHSCTVGSAWLTRSAVFARHSSMSTV